MSVGNQKVWLHGLQQRTLTYVATTFSKVWIHCILQGCKTRLEIRTTYWLIVRRWHLIVLPTMVRVNQICEHMLYGFCKKCSIGWLMFHWAAYSSTKHDICVIVASAHWRCSFINVRNWQKFFNKNTTKANCFRKYCCSVYNICTHTYTHTDTHAHLA